MEMPIKTVKSRIEPLDLARFMEKNKPAKYEVREKPRTDYEKIRRELYSARESARRMGDYAGKMMRVYGEGAVSDGYTGRARDLCSSMLRKYNLN